MIKMLKRMDTQTHKKRICMLDVEIKTTKEILTLSCPALPFGKTHLLVGMLC